MKTRLMALAVVAALAATTLIGGPATAAGTRVTDHSNPEVVTSSCKAEVVIIGARGSGQPDKNYAKQGDGMGPTVKAAADALAKQLPTGTKYRYLSVIYPAYNANLASFLGAGKALPSAYQLSVNGGVKSVKERIKTVLTKCPKSKIVLMGYSQGAQVMHRAVLELEKAKATSQTNAIKAVWLIADPLNDGNSMITYAGDGNKLASYSTVKSWKGGLYSSAVKSPSILTSNKTLSVCFSHDPVCHYTNLLYAKAWADAGGHGVYPASAWTSYPAKYIVAALKRAGV